MVKAIIFDFGGVIAFPGRFDELEKRFSKLFNIPLDKFSSALIKNWDLWKIDKINENEFWRNIFSEVGSDYNVKTVKSLLRESHGLSNETLSLIKELRNTYKIYILSNHAKEWFNDTIKKNNLNELFNGIFVSYDAKSSKPEENIYLKFLEKFKLKAKECIFIDDQPKNIEAAKKIGFDCVLFRNIKSLRKELTKRNVI